MWSLIVAKIKDKFTTKIPTLIFVPAPCPSCGALIEIPMSRSPMKMTCHVCQQVCHSMAIGIVDKNEKRLKYVYDEVVNWTRINSAEYDQMTGENKGSLH